MNIEVSKASTAALAEYARVPIAFDVCRVFDVTTQNSGLHGIALSERPHGGGPAPAWMSAFLRVPVQTGTLERSCGGNMHPTATLLLASIDHTLASARAALAAGADPQQTDDARSALSARAGADIARLVVSARGDEWVDVPSAVFDAIERGGAAADQGDLAEAERELTAAREQLGGRSR
jgi:hypothetical protein